MKIVDFFFSRSFLWRLVLNKWLMDSVRWDSISTVGSFTTVTHGTFPFLSVFMALMTKDSLNQVNMTTVDWFYLQSYMEKKKCC